MALNKWLQVFEKFVRDLRIKSKEDVSSDPRGTPLVLWESQRRFIREVGSGLDSDIHEFYALKSRQLGVTTVSLGIDVFWLAIHDNIIGALVTDTEANREANRALIKHYIKSFDEDYFENSFSITRDNREVMEFSNGATLRFLVAGTKKKSIAWAEGTGYALIHCTEVAKYADTEGVQSLLEGFAQTNPHRLLLMESTANGFNHWKTRWEAAAKDAHARRAFFIGWWSGDTNFIHRGDPRFQTYGLQPPNREERGKVIQVKREYNFDISVEQLAWIRWKESSAGREQELLQQNQPWTAAEAFVESGYSFFAVRELNKDIKKIMDASAQFGSSIENPYTFKGYRYNCENTFFNFSMERLDDRHPENIDLVELKVWEEPQPGGRYVIGFDVAFGRTDHKDGNVITVFRCYADRLVQVAEYATYGVDVRYAAWVFFHLTAAYGNVMGNVEIGGPGRMIMSEITHLRELLGAEHNQARVKEKNWDDAFTQARWYLYHKPDTIGAGYVYNFETNGSTKPRLMHNFRSCYVMREIEIRSRRMLMEMLLVRVNEDGSIGAPDSADTDAKDDRVFAGALATLAWTEWIRRDMMMEGLTYEAVLREEVEPTPILSRRAKSMVYRFLAKQQEEAEAEPPRGPDWMIDNGLV